jgi:hypothetical protein
LEAKVIITIVISATFLIALAMALATPKCLDIQVPGGGKINNCAQGYPPTTIPPALSSVSSNITSPDAHFFHRHYYQHPTYLEGVWNLTGTSNGYPISGQIKFGINNAYQISGKLSNIKNGNVFPFYYLGKYSLDKNNNTLSLTTNTGIKTTYHLANIEKDSLSVSNPTTSEYYTYTRFL